MADPLRVLHFADVHIGMENFGRIDSDSGLSSRVVDFLRRMDEMVQYAADHEVDLVVFAGDAFKTRSPNPTLQREFAWRVQDLRNLAPVVLLVGNHDLPMNASRASSIEIFDTLAVDGVWVAQDYELRRVETRRGPVLVGAAPYPIRSRLLAEQGGLSLPEADRAMQAFLAQALEDMAAQADALDPAGAIPRLLTGHFTVSGAVTGSERGIMLGRDVEVLLSNIADPRWDYVAMGHIHKHQNLTAGRAGVPPVVYSGSLERIDFGEELDAKGFCWVNLARGTADWSFVPLTTRPMVTIDVDASGDEDPTARVVAAIRDYDLQEAIVRLRIRIDAEQEPYLAEGRVREALKAADVFHLAAIIRDVTRANRARLGANPEELTSLQLLERYLMVTDVASERRLLLLAEAENLMREALESPAPGAGRYD
jgi:DNA repair protein SbcD/Mre11